MMIHCGFSLLKRLRLLHWFIGILCVTYFLQVLFFVHHLVEFIAHAIFSCSLCFCSYLHTHSLTHSQCVESNKKHCANTLPFLLLNGMQCKCCFLGEIRCINTRDFCFMKIYYILFDRHSHRPFS